MNDFLDLCEKRQSCRKFSSRTVEHEKLERCAEAGRLTHSGCNAQPWSFIVVETPEKVAEIGKCCQQLNQNAYIGGATAFIVLLEEHAVLNPVIRCFLDSQYFAKGDLGAATAYVCLEAAAQDIGSCIVGIYDRERICELLDIPNEKQFGAVIALGYPEDDRIRPKSRKSFEDVVRFA
jgi:nitroreductase